MKAVDLIRRCRERGVQLIVSGETLLYVGDRRQVDEELLAQLSAEKSGILEELLREHSAQPAHRIVEAQEIPEQGDEDRPSVDRCPLCGQRDFVRPRPRGAWCCARCNPYEVLARSDDEWWPQIDGPLIPLEEVFACEQSTTEQIVPVGVGEAAR